MVHFSSEIHQEVCVWVLWQGTLTWNISLGLVCVLQVDGSLWLLLSLCALKAYAFKNLKHLSERGCFQECSSLSRHTYLSIFLVP